MPNPFRHDDTLPRSKINDLVFKIDQEMAVENKEEFVDVIMLVPVVFALQNAEPHDRVVHLTKSLVVPFVRARIDQLLNIDYFERLVQNVEESLIRKIFGFGRFHDGDCLFCHSDRSGGISKYFYLLGPGYSEIARDVSTEPVLSEVERARHDNSYSSPSK